MSYIKRDGYNEELLKNLKIDCEKCFGLCCVALYFSKCEGFPVDKVAGEPCLNLQSDFRCKIHQELRQKVCLLRKLKSIQLKVMHILSCQKSW